MIERNRRECKLCKEHKDRIFDGRYPNNKDKRWVGQDGLLWVGSICGQCNRSRAKTNMQKARANEKV